MALSGHRAQSMTHDENFSTQEREALETRLRDCQTRLKQATELLDQSRNASIAQELHDCKQKLKDAEHKIQGLNYLTDAILTSGTTPYS